MSGWIQGENGNLYKNIWRKDLKESVANIGKLQEPFRKRKWCLRDFVGTQEGLRNQFATSYSRRAAKLAFILWCLASIAAWNFKGNPKHCAKRLRNHSATKGWFRNTLLNPSFSLEHSSSKGCNFLISAPNRTRFEALDSWLPELWNGI